MDNEQSLPPRADEEEQRILGAILYKPECLSLVRAVLRPSDFWGEKNPTIYLTMCEMADDEDPIDLQLTVRALRTRGRLDNAGGSAYISRLADDVYTTQRIEKYAEIVFEASRRRQLYQLHSAVAKAMHDPTYNVDMAIKSMLNGLEEIGRYQLSTEPIIRSFAEIAERLGPDPEPLVDGLFLPGSVGIIAAEPKVGKTTLVDSWLLSISSGEPVVGEFEVKRKSNTLFVEMEDNERMHVRRVERLVKGMGLPCIPPGFFRWQTKKFSLDIDRDMIRLQDVVEQNDIRIVVVDPLVYVTDGDENSNRDMSNALLPLKRIAEKTGVVVAIIHHYSHSGPAKAATGGGRVRGATTIWAWCDFGVFLSKRGESRHVQIESKELGFKEFHLRLDRTEEGGESLHYVEIIKSPSELKKDRLLEFLAVMENDFVEGWVPLYTVGKDLEVGNPTLRKYAEDLAKEGKIDYQPGTQNPRRPPHIQFNRDDEGDEGNF